MTEEQNKSRFVQWLQMYSVPLLAGVIVAVIAANIVGPLIHQGVYQEWVEHGFGSFSLFGRHIEINAHWIVNDVLMVFFFGIAAKEIVEAMLPGGDLNPVGKAINPLLGTLGGVVGPISVFFLLAHFMYTPEFYTTHDVWRGFGISAATDIALAWLAARIVFGPKHPAVNFLLLLAIADDGIGLLIIAIFYTDPSNPVTPLFLLFTLAGMLVAFGLRKQRVNSWIPYVVFGGGLSWLGLAAAGIEPALALVFILPFMPYAYSDEHPQAGLPELGPAHDYTDALGVFVDLPVLFLFGLINAGVEVTAIGKMTAIILLSLVIGKTVGVSLMAFLGNAIGFKYPTGMSLRHVITVGVVAAMGLTVALFVAGVAFPAGHKLQPAAKFGALLSFGVIIIAYVVGRALNVKKLAEEPQES